MKLRLLCLLAFVWVAIPAATAASFDHSEWDRLLQQHVVLQHDGQASVVDYAGFVRDHARLKAYLGHLAGVDRQAFDAWPRDEQLAFLINAYNAWTVELILSAWPGLASIRDLGTWFHSPWEKAFIPLLGESRSLDDIEHHLIRGSGRYNDSRIHFAVNCASIGCPALRPEAYSGGRLDRQLEEQTNRFLADRSRNHLRERELTLSPIFKWYREDFGKGWRGVHSLADFVARHAAALGMSAGDVEALRSGEIDIGFSDYDWRLNATPA